jgi:hypothetical protein
MERRTSITHAPARLTKCPPIARWSPPETISRTMTSICVNYSILDKSSSNGVAGNPRKALDGLMKMRFLTGIFMCNLRVFLCAIYGHFYVQFICAYV